MNIKEQLDAAFNVPEFKFNETRHTYTFGGQYLTGVTGQCKKWHKPFDRDGISARVAQKEGRSATAVLAEWDAKGKAATDLGTEVHQMIEDYWNGWNGAEKFEFFSEEARKRFAAFYSFARSELPNIVSVASEYKVFSLKYRVAGTIDFIGQHKDNGRVYLFDWKTNGKFRDDRDRAWDKLLPPFEDLDDNELNSYSIQLSLYRLILADANIDTRGGVLVHIPPAGIKPVLYPAKDLTVRLAEALK